MITRLLVAFYLSLSVHGAALADLGGADITGSSGRTSTGRRYAARCGLAKSECNATFVNEKLVINESDGIYRDQFINVVLKKECKQRSILMPWVASCFANQLDWDFTITYKSSDGTQKSALISFMPRYFNTGVTNRAQDFERDLQIWAQNILRPIGPSIEIQPSREPVQTRPSDPTGKAQ
jgi:hypothetical protein